MHGSPQDSLRDSFFYAGCYFGDMVQNFLENSIILGWANLSHQHPKFEYVCGYMNCVVILDVSGNLVSAKWFDN